jgi:hypothetical protein
MPRKPRSDPPRPAGRPFKEITPEMLDDAKAWLGRVVYPSKVVDRLAEKYKCSREFGFKVVDAARAAVIESFKAAGTANDPLTGVYLSLEEVLADPKATRGERIGATSQIIRMLGLNRYLDKLDPNGVEDFIAGVLTRRAERLSGPPAVPPEAPPAPSGDNLDMG